MLSNSRHKSLYDLYASHGSQSYLIFAHNISILLRLGQYGGKKYTFNPCRFHSSIFSSNSALRWIGALSSTITVFPSNSAAIKSKQATITFVSIPPSKTYETNF